MKRVTRLFAMGVLASVFSIGLVAQDKDDKDKDKNTRDRVQQETLTGCLSKDTAGGYSLTNESTGVKTTVTGSTDLEKHSANHKVTLTGTNKTDGGKSVFEVSKIQHISDSCKAGTQ